VSRSAAAVVCLRKIQAALSLDIAQLSIVKQILREYEQQLRIEKEYGRD
jgi:hypothetical protein